MDEIDYFQSQDLEKTNPYNFYSATEGKGTYLFPSLKDKLKVSNEWELINNVSDIYFTNGERYTFDKLTIFLKDKMTLNSNFKNFLDNNEIFFYTNINKPQQESFNILFDFNKESISILSDINWNFNKLTKENINKISIKISSAYWNNLKLIFVGKNSDKPRITTTSLGSSILGNFCISNIEFNLDGLVYEKKVLLIFIGIEFDLSKKYEILTNLTPKEWIYYKDSFLKFDVPDDEFNYFRKDHLKKLTTIITNPDDVKNSDESTFKHQDLSKKYKHTKKKFNKTT